MRHRQLFILQWQLLCIIRTGSTQGKASLYFKWMRNVNYIKLRKKKEKKERKGQQQPLMPRHELCTCWWRCCCRMGWHPGARPIPACCLTPMHGRGSSWTHYPLLVQCSHGSTFLPKPFSITDVSVRFRISLPQCSFWHSFCNRNVRTTPGGHLALSLTKNKQFVCFVISETKPDAGGASALKKKTRHWKG